MLRVSRMTLGGLLLAFACSSESRQSSPPAAAPEPEKSDTSTAAPWVLSAEEIGPVRVGMRVDEARAALAGSLDSPDTSAECAYFKSTAAPEGVFFMVIQGVVERVDVKTKEVPTDRGARIGDREEAVKALYDSVVVQPHKYTSGHYLIVTPADTTLRLVFETNADTVSSMRGGRLPAVMWVEGCS